MSGISCTGALTFLFLFVNVFSLKEWDKSVSVAGSNTFLDDNQRGWRAGHCWSDKEHTTCPEGFFPQPNPWRFPPEEQCIKKENCTCVKWGGCAIQYAPCIQCHPRCKEAYESRKKGGRERGSSSLATSDHSRRKISRGKRDCWVKNVRTTCPQGYKVTGAPWRHPPHKQCYKISECNTCITFANCRLSYACCIRCTPRCCDFYQVNCKEGLFHC